MQLCAFLLLFCIFPISVSLDFSDVFMTDHVTVISEQIAKKSYFSYSLLLQSSENSASLIVGAPKNQKEASNENGDIYRCTWTNKINSPTCVVSSAGQTLRSTGNGNLFGISMDGEDQENGSVVVCAPRFQTSEINSNQPYTKGYCLYIKNSSNLETNLKPIIIFEEKSYEDISNEAGVPFYDYGYAMGGFDVSFYNENGPKMFIGAPGVKKLSGNTATYSLESLKLSTIMPHFKDLNYEMYESDGYLGYSVAALKLSEGSIVTDFLAGAPRGNNLKGLVRLFRYNSSKKNMEVIKTFNGVEIGAYFGASLLAIDVTGDKFVDILISAPTTKGNSWDEGAVHFFPNIGDNRDSKPNVIIRSDFSKPGGKFGSAMSSLGDYDLDGFNDVAISAPYEDDGIGAVYIYRGGLLGLTLAQRISPSEFHLKDSVKGFGLGLSRGNDIDFNGHNDVAVGAYKTDQVFIIHTRNIIDFVCHLIPSTSLLSSSMSNFGLTLCIVASKRSEKFSIPNIQFNVYMDSMDHRLISEKNFDVMMVPFNNRTCKVYMVRVKQDALPYIQPLEVNVTVDVENKNVVASGNKVLYVEIPYQHGCKSDNVCDTGLSLTLSPKTSDFVLGKDQEITMDVVVRNDGDPAYKCELNIEVPAGVELRGSKYCTKNHTAYECSVSEKLEGSNVEVTKTYTFDVRNLNISMDSINVSVSVRSFGKNKPGYKNQDILTIPVRLETTPFLNSQRPENYQLNTKYKEETEVVVSHNFTVEKIGPSPLLFDLDISIPLLKYKDENVFKILDVKVLMGTEISCTGSTEATPIHRHKLDIPNVPLNKTKILACVGDSSCEYYTCKKIRIDNSRDVAIFQVRTTLNANLLVKVFLSEFNTNDFIAYMPSAVLTYSQGSRNASSVFLIITSQITYIPLWVYLVAAITAVVFLIPIIFAMYKCHFFDRNYKDKLMQQKILDEDDAINDEIFREDVFRRMKSFDEADINRILSLGKENKRECI